MLGGAPHGVWPDDIMISYSHSSPFLLMFPCLFILFFRNISDICLNDTNSCHAEETKMSRPFPIPWRSVFLVRSEVLGMCSHTQWQAVRIVIRWLLQRPTNLDLHCLQRQGMFGFSRTRFNSLYMLLQCENLLLWVMILRGNEFYKPLRKHAF